MTCVIITLRLIKWRIDRSVLHSRQGNESGESASGTELACLAGDFKTEELYRSARKDRFSPMKTVYNHVPVRSRIARSAVKADPGEPTGAYLPGRDSEYTMQERWRKGIWYERC